MKDSAVAPTLLFDPNRQRRLVMGLVQRVAASKQDHLRLRRERDSANQTLEVQLAQQLAQVKANCVQDRASTLAQWDDAQEKAIAAYEAATIQTRDNLRRVTAKYRRLLADEEAIILGKVEKRVTAVNHQYDSRKGQPKKQQRAEHQQLDEALAAGNEDLQLTRELTIRRLNRFLDVQMPSNVYDEFGEVAPATVRDAHDMILRLNRRLKTVGVDMQKGAAAKTVDSFYLPAGVAVFIALWAFGSLVFHAQPLLYWMAAGVPVAGVIGFGIYAALLWPLRQMTRQLHPLSERIRRTCETANATGKQISKRHAESAAKDLLDRRQAHLAEAKRWRDEQLAQARQDIQDRREREQTMLETRLAEIDEQFRGGFATLQKTMRERADQIAQNISQTLSSTDAAVGQTRQQADQRHQLTLEILTQRLQIALRRGMNRIMAADDLLHYRFPAWTDILRDPGDAHESVDFLPVGSLVLGRRFKQQLDHAIGDAGENGSASGDSPATLLHALKTPDHMPLALHRRRQSGILIETPASHREDAIAIAHQMLWRLMSAAPPGRARLTLIDPIGRGQNFASFMALADHDPTLIHHRVWTSGETISKRLAELTHHVEDVLQASLRDRFERIEDYNAEAGSLAEPYHAVAAIGFPEGLSRDGHAHLRSLIQNGRRCGVFVILVVDSDMPWPVDMPKPDTDDLLHIQYFDDTAARREPNATTASGTAAVNGSPTDDAKSGNSKNSHPPAHAAHPRARFELVDESILTGHWRCLSGGLEQFEFRPAPPPPPEVREPLLRRIGRAAADAARVRVPLRSLLPGESILDEKTTHCTRNGIRIILGSQGAGRTLTLELGAGVLQHVLIAGKTGSGKSTLLHSLITAGAAAYRPDELTFYLLDFKKGVEFKVYADSGLPHARVIGIESEREFGRSVLQKLDQELTRRGEAFRAASVGDLAEYRDARPDQSMPRIMLVIDEFQELFTRDDVLASECTSLLDRLVRQGRSFGVHIVLSSQSLAGANSLPRATLGQMAVRIAMQCGESDAALILGDDNHAARLLSRPGEAIYNNAGGLVEGNHPFQAAWLDAGDHRGLLAEIVGRDQSFVRSLGPPIIFEGNRPSRLTTALLRSAIDDFRSANQSASSTAIAGLLGEAVELGPPTTITLRRQSGCNVLFVAPMAARLGVVASILTTARMLGDDLRIELLDGSRGDEGESIAAWLSQAGFSAASTKPRDAESKMSELAAEIDRRTVLLDAAETPLRPTDSSSGDPSGGDETGGDETGGDETGADAAPGVPPIICVIDSLDRFRDLRQDDSYKFSLDADAAPGGDKLLQKLLRDGPVVGIWTILTMASAESLGRWLPRQSHHDLELRLVGHINAADSSLLIDSPLAADLSAATMILYDESDGRVTKFRPCDPPDPSVLAMLMAPPAIVAEIADA